MVVTFTGPGYRFSILGDGATYILLSYVGSVVNDYYFHGTYDSAKAQMEDIIDKYI